jgi:DNA-binding transcriptional LysR family regulator
MLDLRLVRAFVVVAELEHVGRAARALHVSQSPLSRQLQKLQEELGIDLFERQGRGLRLTTAGRSWLAEARALLARAERAAAFATALARGQSESLVIGFVQSAIWSSLVPSAVQKLRRARPDAYLTLRALRSAEQAMALHRGELDVGIAHRAPDDGSLESILLLDEPLQLVLPRGHRLADRKRIGPDDLHGEEFVALGGAASTDHHERLLAACGKAGFVPRIAIEAHQFATVLGLVEAGMGVALVQHSARRAGARVIFRDLPWFPLSVRSYVLHRANPTPIVQDFSRLLLAERDGLRAPASPRRRRP